MKIYCIVLFTSLSRKEKIEVSQYAGWLSTEPHLAKIQQFLPVIINVLDDRDGIHRLKTDEDVYYAYLDHDKLAIAVFDEEISPLNQFNFFQKVFAAQNQQALESLLNNPQTAIEGKIDLIKKELEETVEVLRADVEKLVEREEMLTQLIEKTAALNAESLKFSKRATDLKNQTRCPGLFSFFNSVKSWFGGGNYEYDYEPAAQNKL